MNPQTTMWGAKPQTTSNGEQNPFHGVSEYKGSKINPQGFSILRIIGTFRRIF